MKDSRYQYVIDTNILLDFYYGGILQPLLQLPFQLMTTDLIVHELKRHDKGLEILETTNSHIIIKELNGGEIREIDYIRRDQPELSIQDISALILSSKIRNLLTGDGPLRAIAMREGFKVHGTLYLLDKMVFCGVISKSDAIKALKMMLQNGRWLPQRECESRMKKWREE